MGSRTHVHDESPKTPTAGRRRRSIPNLKDYTGCRAVRGSHGVGHKHDPLGKDTPPRDWPHPKPSYEEVLKALDEEANA